MNPHPAVSLHSLRESWLCAGVEVLDTLVHELIHASDDCELRRGASAGLELQGKLQAIALQLGPYPHARLKAVSRKSSSGKRARAQCAQCGYQVPMLRRFLSFGPPICPVDKAAMEPLGDWEEL